MSAHREEEKPSELLLKTPLGSIAIPAKIRGQLFHLASFPHFLLVGHVTPPISCAEFLGGKLAGLTREASHWMGWVNHAGQGRRICPAEDKFKRHDIELNS